MKQITVDKLTVKMMETRKEMGEVAATDICKKIKELLDVKEELNIIFAAAPSQNDVLQSLIDSDVDWSRVNAYHMDEYIGLDKSAPQGFGNFLVDHIWGKAPFKSVNRIDCEAEDPEKECERYAKLLEEHPVDIIVLGIGENGHIAFNDPPADFETKEAYIVVDLNERCKAQQMGEGWFATIDDVPKQAVSMTAYQIMLCKKIISCVPYKVKSEAISKTLAAKEVSNLVPATLLKTHPDFVLYIDSESASEISEINFID